MALQDQFACEIYEEIIRYHILCEHELCENEATVRDPEGFSSHLNVEQLNKVASSFLYGQSCRLASSAKWKHKHSTAPMSLVLLTWHELFCGSAVAHLAT